jgi:hypothetical protein
MDMVIAGNRMHLGLSPESTECSREDDSVVVLVKRASTKLFIAVDGFPEPFTIEQRVPIQRAIS